MNVAELFEPSTFGAYHGNILYVFVACTVKCMNARDTKYTFCVCDIVLVILTFDLAVRNRVTACNVK